MSELTFRDFAGAMMGNDTPRGAEVLGELLGLDGPAATRATRHFKDSAAADATFMGKAAMGLRAAVTTGTDEEIDALLGECFGLGGDAIPSARATLRTRYPRPAT